ncbi:MAG TPA: class I SAM-dependent methyltransferase [Dehalococcoidia bacterium]|nr:class I SAM-dependent methyltransferase [Dehalococcoidia bacterium]
MDKSKSNLGFRLMALTFNVRDFFAPRINILKEVGIKQGFHVLDYGCGPGSYILPLAEIVGRSGKIYALDMHPAAIKMVKNLALKKKVTNIETIHSDCKTGLLDSSLDVVLLYDTLHDLSEPDKVLQELHRVLKPTGVLSISDHHMKEVEIVSRLTKTGLYKISTRGKKTYTSLRAT